MQRSAIRPIRWLLAAVLWWPAGAHAEANPSAVECQRHGGEVRSFAAGKAGEQPLSVSFCRIGEALLGASAFASFETAPAKPPLAIAALLHHADTSVLVSAQSSCESAGGKAIPIDGGRLLDCVFPDDSHIAAETLVAGPRASPLLARTLAHPGEILRPTVEVSSIDDVADQHRADALRAIFRPATAAVARCYTKALERTPDLEGEIRVALTTNTAGAISELDVTAPNDELERCVSEIVRPLRPGRPAGSAVVTLALSQGWTRE